MSPNTDSSEPVEAQNDPEDIHQDDLCSPLLSQTYDDTRSHHTGTRCTETYHRTFELETYNNFDVQKPNSKLAVDLKRFRVYKKVEQHKEMVVNFRREGRPNNTLVRAKIDYNTEFNAMSRNCAEKLFGKRTLRGAIPYPICSTFAGKAYAIASVTLRWCCKPEPGITKPIYRFANRFEESTFHIMQLPYNDCDLILGKNEIERLELHEDRLPFSAANNLFTGQLPRIDANTATHVDLRAQAERAEEEAQMARDEQHKKDRNEFAQSRAEIFALAFAKDFRYQGSSIYDQMYRSQYQNQLDIGRVLFEQHYGRLHTLTGLSAERDTFARRYAHSFALEHAKRRCVHGGPDAFDSAYHTEFQRKLLSGGILFDSTHP